MAHRTRRRPARSRSTRRQAKPTRTRSPLTALFMLPLLPLILSMHALGLALRLSLGIVALSSVPRSALPRVVGGAL